METYMTNARVRTSRNDLVLDVGSGGHAHSSADILVDLYIEDAQRHRGGRPLVSDRPFVQADILDLPFVDEAFDYVIANQIIEHVEDPVRALGEITRVGRRGYVSMPTEFHEMICGHPMHRWVFAYRNGELLIKRKAKPHSYGTEHLYGGVFWMLHTDAAFKRLMLKHSALFWVSLEWEGTVSSRLVPPDEPFYDYHSPESVRSLLKTARPDSLAEWVKWQLRTHLDLEALSQVSRSAGRLRRLAKRLVARPDGRDS
jgi:SAM-dependent methyltransferase